MTEALTVTTERVDDIPLLLAQSERMGIADLLDSYFKPHGKWKGTSLGWTPVVWLTHLLSEGDHRLIHLSVVTLGQQTHRHLTPLSELQLRILGLLDVSPVIYGRLGAESPQPP